MSGSLRYCGRDFLPAELDRIRALIAHTDPPLSRTRLSQAVCEALDWRKPDGGLKEMSARVALLRMQRDGLLTLPPPLTTKPRLRPLAPSPRTDPPPLWPLPASLAQARPLRLSLLRPSDPRSRLWNEFVERYHYLGYKPLPGAQLRYFVHAADGLLLALLGFGAAAWKTAPRDRFVGWDPPTRQRNLPLVVNHARYLILPWIRLPSLASHLLACLQRQLPDDWQQRYGLRPVLLETFCETPHFQGTCYRAANWLHLGQTQGRGKLDSARVKTPRICEWVNLSAPECGKIEGNLLCFETRFARLSASLTVSFCLDSVSPMSIHNSSILLPILVCL